MTPIEAVHDFIDGKKADVRYQFINRFLLTPMGFKEQILAAKFIGFQRGSGV
ncbi:MAG: hypothetical protein K8T10_13220 [Candidatus Eremiobacteraeota bacterium]|nr:hypothetical protein [Candidatus Eremiobacteraeota bacterium]